MQLTKSTLDRPFKPVLPVTECLFLNLPAISIKIAGEVRYHFGIGLACKFDTFVLQPRFKRVIVFNDAIVNDSDFTRVIQMRMRIDGIWLSVSCPARMSDTVCLISIGLIQHLLQVFDSTACFFDSYRSAAHHRDSGRVVTTIFQPL